MNPTFFYNYTNSLSTSFVSTWKTDNVSTGSSLNNQVKLPLVSNGRYNFSVNWGDGNLDSILTYNQTEVTHTYAATGTYTITITGLCFGFIFANSGDKNKILSVSKWGCLRLQSLPNAFFGCLNLTLDTVSDLLNVLIGGRVLEGLFRGCESLITVNRINEWQTQNCTTLYTMFYMFGQNNNAFNQSLSFNTISVINFESMFTNCRQLNSLISFNYTNAATFLDFMTDCYVFNQPINIQSTKSSINMQGMFRNAFAFNQDISVWNVSNVVDLNNFMTGKTNLNYSTSNYDALLIGWASRSVQPNLTANFGTIKRTAASTSARSVLTSAPNNWSITDGGI
jgi:hypothetical protein